MAQKLYEWYITLNRLFTHWPLGDFEKMSACSESQSHFRSKENHSGPVFSFLSGRWCFLVLSLPCLFRIHNTPGWYLLICNESLGHIMHIMKACIWCGSHKEVAVCLYGHQGAHNTLARPKLEDGAQNYTFTVRKPLPLHSFVSHLVSSLWSDTKFKVIFYLFSQIFIMVAEIYGQNEVNYWQRRPDFIKCDVIIARSL